MTKEFVKIVNETSFSSLQVFRPITFRQKLLDFAPLFTEEQQHDSQQFINFLLDALHEDSNKISEKPYIEGKSCQGKSEEEIATECWNAHLKRNDSKIVELIHGQFKSSLTCKQCNYESITFDPFQVFCLEIPKINSQNKKQRNLNQQQITLQECFSNLEKEEELEGQNQFLCSTCNNQVNGIKKINLYKVPEVFIVYLKRFKQNDYKIEKSETSVNYPVSLDLSPFLPQNYQGTKIYDLYAVNNHSGKAGGGHYYAYAKVDQE